MQGHNDEKLMDTFSIKDFINQCVDLFHYLKKHIIIIIIIGLVGGIIGYLYAWKQPIKYTARMTFVVEEGKSGVSLGGLASLAGQFGVDVGGSASSGLLSGDNILHYFKSTSLAREVLLSRLNNKSDSTIADLYIVANKLDKAWGGNKEIGHVKFKPLDTRAIYTRIEDSLLQTIVNGILKSQFNVLRIDKKASFIEVSAVMQNEYLTKTYCERIVKEAIDKYISVKTQKQQATVNILQSRVDSVAKLLSTKTSSAAKLQASSSTMDINPLYRAAPSIAIETVARDKTILGSIFASITQNLELAKFSLSQETPTIQIVDYPIMPLKKEKKSKLYTAIIFSIAFGFVGVLSLLLKRFFLIFLR